MTASTAEERKSGKKKGGKKEKDKEKGGSGIFKGLGHMFRSVMIPNLLTEILIVRKLKIKFFTGYKTNLFSVNSSDFVAVKKYFCKQIWQTSKRRGGTK